MNSKFRMVSVILCLWLLPKISGAEGLMVEGSGAVSASGATVAAEMKVVQGTEREFSREEEHESNGPQGSAGVPMQRLPLVQMGLAVALLLATWRLMPRHKA